MNSEELPQDSDSSDEDYVPESKQEVLSEVDSDGDSEDPLSDCEDQPRNKRTKRIKKGKQVKKKSKVEDNETNEPKLVTCPIDEKKKVDDLWADFMKDTGFKSKNTKVESSKPIEKNEAPLKSQKNENKEEKAQSAKVKIKQIFEFAGEEVVVEKEVDKASAEARLLSSNSSTSNKGKKNGGLSGIGGVLSQLGKKQKISTLEKTKLDWDKFKQEENIEEELQTYNKGKDGYLDRQDFLQRADLRRFEIEKDIRNTERAKRFNSAL